MFCQIYVFQDLLKAFKRYLMGALEPIEILNYLFRVWKVEGITPFHLRTPC